MEYETALLSFMLVGKGNKKWKTSPKFLAIFVYNPPEFKKEFTVLKAFGILHTALSLYSCFFSPLADDDIKYNKTRTHHQ